MSSDMPTNITSFDAYRDPSNRAPSESAKGSPKGFSKRVPPPLLPPQRLAPLPMLTQVYTLNSEIQTLRYVARTMPKPGTPGAPRFEGRNISEFLDSFERIYKRYDIRNNARILEILPDYCG